MLSNLSKPEIKMILHKINLLLLFLSRPSLFSRGAGLREPCYIIKYSVFWQVFFAESSCSLDLLNHKSNEPRASRDLRDSKCQSITWAWLARSAPGRNLVYQLISPNYIWTSKSNTVTTHSCYLNLIIMKKRQKLSSDFLTLWNTVFPAILASPRVYR